jgi:predicted nucleotidyltransferase
MAFRDEIIGKIRQQYPYLEKKYGVKRIGLFGSVVRREEGPDSDVDIVVEFSNPVGLSFMEFAREMEQLCGRQVDVLTPEGIRNIRVQDVSTSIKKDIVYV